MNKIDFVFVTHILAVIFSTLFIIFLIVAILLYLLRMSI
jgi:hypothetical protein